MAKYRVYTQFVFSGYFDVEADSVSEARRNVTDHCGLAMGGNIHTTLPDEEVDWDFSTHPDTEIESIQKINNIRY